MLFSVSTRLMKKGTRASVSSVLCGNRRVLEPARLERRLGKTRKVKFDVVLEPEATYYPISKNLWDKLQAEATKQRVSSDTLVRTIESATAPAQFTEDPRPSRDCSPTASCRSKYPPAHTSRPRANLFFFCYKFFDLITQRENP